MKIWQFLKQLFSIFKHSQFDFDKAIKKCDEDIRKLKAEIKQLEYNLLKLEIYYYKLEHKDKE